MSSLSESARASKAWPFAEARKLVDRLERGGRAKSPVLFQTGYGPSGLPHIGTFAEVARTTMVRRAFESMTGQPTRLVSFSDDMDGFRKIPENVPNREELKQDLDLPLSRVRDPFGRCESFAAHNNAMLRSFLDRFGFEYEFLSATECYRKGMFDEMLLTVLERFDAVMEIMLPSLGAVTEGRRDTYSPFLPISPKSGRVLQVPTLERIPSRGAIVYEEPDGEKVEIPVTGGNVKLQWKPDWAMRWAALGIDYEMYGKDLIPSAELGEKICRALGREPPVGMAYELFLDAGGQKISKSKGTGGVTVDEWLSYASAGSLGAYMYQKPQTAKRLYPEVIPRTVDEYQRHLESFPGQSEEERLGNPAWHVHGGKPPSPLAVSYSMLVNLISAAGTEEPSIVWGFIGRYAPGISPESAPDLAQAVEGAIRYVKEQVAPSRRFRDPDDRERAALGQLRERLLARSGERDAGELQSLVFSVGMEHGFEPLRDWFKAIYEILLGSSHGPRFGGFVALYGIEETAALIERKLATG